MGTTRSAATAANTSPVRNPVTLAPKQKQRIVSIARRQGISPSDVILRSLDLYEQDDAPPKELVHQMLQMQTVLDRSLATLRDARHAVDESNRLILHYRQHPELLKGEGS